MFAMQALRVSKIPTIFRKIGLFEPAFLIMEETWSKNFKNLNIFLEFFIEFLSFKATTAPRMAPILNIF